MLSDSYCAAYPFTRRPTPMAPSNENSIPRASRATLKSRSVRSWGTLTPSSNRAIVPLVTELASANSCWLMPSHPRAALTCSLFITGFTIRQLL